MKKNKIVITGGTSRFASVFKKSEIRHELFFPSKNELNILNYQKIKKYLSKIKPKILIHLAGLSRPMKIHEEDIKKSIDLNIIGTANVTKACEEKNIKLIYFSTHYVYPGTEGNYKETDPLLPVNNYAWSKLGGEASVQMYKNSLILRLCMTEKPFVHDAAYANVTTSFIYHEKVAEILRSLLSKKGILNIGGKKRIIYDFVKKENKFIKKIFLKKKDQKKIKIPINSSLNITKLKKIIKNIKL